MRRALSLALLLLLAGRNAHALDPARSIAPYFWQTTWFWLLAALGLFSLPLLAHVLHTRSLRARAARLERAVEEATRVLAERTDERLARTAQIARFGEFAATIAHNLKAPLTFLRGQIELLEERVHAGAPSAEIESRITALHEQCRRMRDEIEAGMRFVRPSSSAKAELDLSALAREIATLLGPRASAANLRIAVEARGAVRVHGNLDNLRHALANLVTNAIEAGGNVTISVAGEGAGAIVRVSDDGPGVPAGIRQTLFRPFVSTKGEHGLGLGLASCRRIIEDEHGGAIRLVDSARGATFVIELPAELVDDRHSRPHVREAEVTDHP